MIENPPPEADPGSGPQRDLTGLLTAPFAMAGRTAFAVVWFPLRNLGKNLPLGG